LKYVNFYDILNKIYKIGVIMAFINKNGESVSFECSELIGELKRDIAEFGGDTIVCVWCQKYKGVELYTNYDFINDIPIKERELEDGEYLRTMSMTALLILLEKENELI
jgi:hypothetical protein